MKLSSRIVIPLVLALAVSGSIAAKAPAKQAAKPSLIKKTGKAPASRPKPAKPAPKALPRLLELGSTTCTPCKMMTPILDELSAKYKGKLKVDFIDIKKYKGAIEKYRIQAIPTQVFFDAKGKEIFRHEGFYPKEDILKKFKELGIKL